MAKILKNCKAGFANLYFFRNYNKINDKGDWFIDILVVPLQAVYK
jgi:hypothetical protein